MPEMNITKEDIQVFALQIGHLTMQIAVLEREKREILAALTAAGERLEMLGNPDGLRVDGLTQRLMDG